MVLARSGVPQTCLTNVFAYGASVKNTETARLRLEKGQFLSWNPHLSPWFRCALEFGSQRRPSDNSQFNALFPTSSTFLRGLELLRKHTQRPRPGVGGGGRRGAGKRRRVLGSTPHPGRRAVGGRRKLPLPAPQGAAVTLQIEKDPAGQRSRPRMSSNWSRVAQQEPSPACKPKHSPTVVATGILFTFKRARTPPQRPRTTGWREGQNWSYSPFFFLLFLLICSILSPNRDALKTNGRKRSAGKNKTFYSRCQPFRGEIWFKRMCLYLRVKFSLNYKYSTKNV